MKRRLRLLVGLLGLALFCRMILSAPTRQNEHAAGHGADAFENGHALSAVLPRSAAAPSRSAARPEGAPARRSAPPAFAFPSPVDLTREALDLAHVWTPRPEAPPAASTDAAYAALAAEARGSAVPERSPEAARPRAAEFAARDVGVDEAATADSLYATLPLDGPIPLPGNAPLSSNRAPRTPPEAVRQAASPVAPIGTVVKHDAHGTYREAFATVTAYCPCTRCCGQLARGITSTGTSAWVRGLAADPERLEYGTTLFVPGYGVATVDDTGGAMRQAWRRRGRLHVDVRMDYHWEARQWGRQFLVVRIYEPAPATPAGAGAAR